MPLLAQSGTSSALAGSVADQSGAVIANAQVKATEINTGAVRDVQSNADGRFLFSQVNPGTYRIEVRAAGFGPGQSQPVSVSVGQTATVNFTLSLASTSQSIEVTAQSGLMSLDNANTSTTLEAKTIKSLPNPGQDLTYVAQFARGRADEYGGIVERRQGRGRLRQRRVQRAACDLERLYSRRLRRERSVSRTEHRPLHEPCHRAGRVAGGDREHQLLCGRSGTLRGLAGELLHQVGDEPVSRRCVRDMERFAVQRDRLLSSCQRHAGKHCEEAALDGE